MAWGIFERELPVLRQAPFSFTIAILAGALSGAYFASLFYDREIANLNSEIRLRDGKLEEFQELQERLRNVERILSENQLTFRVEKEADAMSFQRALAEAGISYEVTPSDGGYEFLFNEDAVER